MKTQKLSDLEQKVMDIVWSKGSCSVREVMISLSPQKKLAYTTVATILQRLYDKGLVTKKCPGLARVYCPRISKETYSRRLFQLFLDSFMVHFGDVAITSFADSIDKLPEEKRIKLLQRLEDNEKA